MSEYLSLKTFAQTERAGCPDVRRDERGRARALRPCWGRR